jgi:acyl carrier protein
MEVKERVIKVVSDKLDLPTNVIKLNDDFTEDYELDSLDMAEIMLGIEEEFGLRIDNEDFSKIKTVGDLVEKVDTMRRGW